MVWKIVKKFRETGNTLDRPDRGRKRSVRSPQLLKNTREKLWRNPREAAEPWPPQQVSANPPCTRRWGTIWGRSPLRCCIARSLRPIMWPWGPKNAGKSCSRWPTARCQNSCSRTKRNSTFNRWYTSKMTEFVFVIHRGKDRQRAPRSAVCHGLGGHHRDQDVPSTFCVLWS